MSKTSSKAMRQVRYLPVLVMAFVGVATSLGMFATMRGWEWRQINAELTVASNSRMAAIYTELDVDEDAVDAIHVFCTVHGETSEADFRAFVAPFTADAPGLLAFTWIPSKRTASGVEQFPIQYAEPRRHGRSLIGVDLASDARLCEAFVKLRDSGKSAILTDVALPLEPVGLDAASAPDSTANAAAPAKLAKSPKAELDNGYRWTLFVRPVYEKNSSHETTKQHRETFRGFVVGIFSMDELVDVAMKNVPPENIHIDLYDMTTPRRPRLFHRHVSRADPELPPFVPTELLRIKDFDLQIGDANWRIVCFPTPTFIDEHQTWKPWGVLYVALAMTGVGCIIVEGTVRRALRNERELTELAEKIGQSESRYRELSEDLVVANRELEHLFQAAQAATQAKSEFLANMSHEIRTPLTAIIGHADLLLDSLPQGEELQAAAAVRRNGDYLLAIIDDILDLSKIETGRLGINRIACSPCQLLAELGALMEVGARAKGLSFQIDCDGPLPETIVTDPVRLRQILVNVVGNAVKFTEAGEVRVTTRFLPAPSEDPKLQIDVADTGIGMTEEQMRRLFQPFVQADSSITRKFGGTGLGLALSKRLATMLGGNVTVCSEPGRGSTFTITVATGPVSPGSLRDRTQRPLFTVQEQSSPPSCGRLEGRILLAEDGVDNQRLLTRMLERAGAEVVVARNGQEAVDMILASLSGAASEQPDPSRPFDLVLMDIQMPVMDGYEATRRLRSKGFDRPIVALTAHAMTQDVQRCLEAGCNLHLAKPFHQEDLLRTVAQFLEASPTSQERTAVPSE